MLKQNREFMFKILLIEDDNDINFVLTKFLEQDGYQVISAFSGTEGWHLYQKHIEEINLVLLDLMLPGMMGEDIITQIRKESTVPIIAISGKSGVQDKVQVFALGGDDYMVKPFAREEVLARVKAQLRRHHDYDRNLQQEQQSSFPNTLVYGKLKMNCAKHTVTYENQFIDLTQTQFALLQVMLNKPRQVFSRDALYRSIWGEDAMYDDNSINVHMSNLRRKLQEVAEQDLIETIWGIGYKLKSQKGLR